MDPEFIIPEDILDAAVAATPETLSSTPEVATGEVPTFATVNPQDLISAALDPQETKVEVEAATKTVSTEEVQPVEEEVNPITARFSGASWFTKFQELEIVLAGVGGIGSYVAFMLSRMQPAYLTLVDPDRVELVNLAGQLFSSTNVGRLKADSIADFVRSYSQYYNVCTLSTRIDKDHCPVSPIMICGFDNMDARKDFFRAWEAQLGTINPSEALFIDGRLSAEAFQVITIQGDDKSAIERYKKEFLFTDSEADATVCSYKQTTYMAAMIASTILNTLTNWVATQAGEWRPVPFFIEYDATIVNFKTEM